MQANLLQNQCRNFKVRPLISDDLVKDNLRSPIINSPLFQSWKWASNADQVALSVLANASQFTLVH